MLHSKAIAISVLSAALLTAVRPWAHSSSDRFLRHHVSVSVAPANVDVVIDLAFYGSRAHGERERMDADGDGRLSNQEPRAYLDSLIDDVRDRLMIDVDGARLRLIPLYAPEADLLEVDAVAPSPCVLRFHFFARTSEVLEPGGRIEIENRIRPDIPAIYAFDVQSQDGIVLSEESAGGVFATGGTADARKVFSIIGAPGPPDGVSAGASTHVTKPPPAVTREASLSPAAIWIIAFMAAAALASLGIRAAVHQRKES